MCDLVCKNIITEDMYPYSIKNQVIEFQKIISNDEENNTELDNLIPIMNELNFKNKEEFYQSYFKENCFDTAIEYLNRSLNYQSASLLCRKLAEHIYIFFKKDDKKNDDEIRTRNLDEREMAALQYLGGYVIHKLFSNLYKSQNKENNEKIQEQMSVLKAMKADGDQIKNEKLIQALSRGGLWSLNGHTEKNFMIAEKYFSVKSDANSHTIKVFDMIKAIMEFTPVIEEYKSILFLSEIRASKEMAKLVLYNVLHLFLKVRSFSLVRDILQKDKIEKHKIGKSKSLRKSCKSLQNMQRNQIKKNKFYI